MKTNFRNFIMMSLVAGSLSIYSCRNSEEKKDEPAAPMQNEMHQEGEMEGMDNTGETTETTAEFKDQNTAEVYNFYVQIKDALVKTNPEKAQATAKEMLSQLESGNETAEVKSAVEQIANSTNVNEQREAFSKLTGSMESVLEGALASGEIYKQFCPMAFEGKGDYWFSNSKEIMNPYYGDKMLHCGRVEETIN